MTEMNGAGMTRARLLRAGAALLAGAAGTAVSACRVPGVSNEPPPAANQPATIIIDNDWVAGDRYKVIQAWLERANRVYPQFKTELREQGSGPEGQARTIANFAADQQGDLVQLNNYLVPVLGPKNLLLEISSTLASLRFDPNNLYDFKEITHYNGKRHGLMVQLNALAMIYNKQLYHPAPHIHRYAVQREDGQPSPAQRAAAPSGSGGRSLAWNEPVSTNQISPIPFSISISHRAQRHALHAACFPVLPANPGVAAARGGAGGFALPSPRVQPARAFSRQAMPAQKHIPDIFAVVPGSRQALYWPGPIAP